MDMSYTSSSPTSTLQSPTQVLAGVDGAAVEWQLDTAHHDTHNLAGEGVGGGVGDHVCAAGGGLAMVHHAGELRTLVKLQPRDLNLAAAVFDLDVIFEVEGGDCRCGNDPGGEEEDLLHGGVRR